MASFADSALKGYQLGAFGRKTYDERKTREQQELDRQEDRIRRIKQEDQERADQELLTDFTSNLFKGTPAHSPDSTGMAKSNYVGQLNGSIHNGFQMLSDEKYGRIAAKGFDSLTALIGTIPQYENQLYSEYMNTNAPHIKNVLSSSNNAVRSQALHQLLEGLPDGGTYKDVVIDDKVAKWMDADTGETEEFPIDELPDFIQTSLSSPTNMSKLLSDRIQARIENAKENNKYLTTQRDELAKENRAEQRQIAQDRRKFMADAGKDYDKQVREGYIDPVTMPKDQFLQLAGQNVEAAYGITQPKGGGLEAGSVLDVEIMDAPEGDAGMTQTPPQPKPIPAGAIDESGATGATPPPRLGGSPAAGMPPPQQPMDPNQPVPGNINVQPSAPEKIWEFMKNAGGASMEWLGQAGSNVQSWVQTPQELQAEQVNTLLRPALGKSSNLTPQEAEAIVNYGGMNDQELLAMGMNPNEIQRLRQYYEVLNKQGRQPINYGGGTSMTGMPPPQSR